MTLIELLIAVGIAAILATAVFSLFFMQSRGVRGQQAVVDLQDNARVALDVLSRDLRNTGFFITPGGAIRIEDDCAKSSLSYQAGAANPWQIGGGGGTAVMSNGDNLFTTASPMPSPPAWQGNDRCPNGSDRITLASRPRSDTVSCNNAVQSDCAQEPGAGTVYNLPCDSCTAADPGSGCNTTLEKISAGSTQVVDCTGCPGGNQVLNRNVSICSENDPTMCADVHVDTVHCCDNAAGPACGGKFAGIALKVTHPWDNNFAGGDWAAIGGKQNPASFGGINHRTYQLLDLDGDGSPELVYSDLFYAAMGMAGTGGAAQDALDPQWTVVAYGVEDLQFAYQFQSGVSTNTWVNQKSLWETGGCANSATVECLQGHYGATKDPLIAVRISMVVRSQTKETGLDGQLLAGGRPPLEDNLATPTPGGTGYRRRVLSTVVGLRNLSQ